MKLRLALAGPAIVAAVALAGCGSDSDESSTVSEPVEESGHGGERAHGSSRKAALDRCLKAWNSDVEALNLGVHNSISHGYEEVQVGYMPERGSTRLVTDPDGGECTVVFAREEPDPEPEVAGRTYRGSHWIPLTRVVDQGELATLQRDAVADANATVNQYGKLREK
jgi:hypothetical protein